MRLRGSIVFVALLSAFVAHTVEGFGLGDMIQALEARELKKTTRDVLQTPDEGIVAVVLEELDSNNDGQVSLQEVRDMADRLFESRRYMENEIVITMAKLLDSDASGIIERNEMDRAASILVTELGAEMLATVVVVITKTRSRVDGINYLQNVGRPVVFPAIDRDGDGQITQQDRVTLTSLRMFQWMSDDINRIIDSSDTNEDGVVTEAEFNQFFEELDDSSDVYYIRKLVWYARVAAIGGFELADSSANNGFM